MRRAWLDEFKARHLDRLPNRSGFLRRMLDALRSVLGRGPIARCADCSRFHSPVCPFVQPYDSADGCPLYNARVRAQKEKGKN